MSVELKNNNINEVIKGVIHWVTGMERKYCLKNY